MSERSLDEIISISNCSDEDWRQEAKDQAKLELRRRGITIEQEKEIIDNWNKEFEILKNEWEIQLIENENISYRFIQIIIIMISAPFILSGRFNYDRSVSDLREENFKIKVKQRILSLITGAIIWIISFYILSNTYI